jgi:asparagine synthase (glutamine-hydrolysing)
VGRAVAAIAGHLAPGPRTRRMAELFGQPASLGNAYTSFRGVFTRAEASRLTEKYAGVSPAGCVDRGPDPEPSPTPGDAVSRMEITRYMRNQLLRDADTMSMASGLELRVPFLDRRLADTLGSIPADLRLRPPKQLLLDAVPEVPAWIRSQPKRGFLFPMEHWLGREWREVFAGIDRTSPVPTGTWYRKWCVFVLEQWVDRMKRDCHG